MFLKVTIIPTLQTNQLSTDILVRAKRSFISDLYPSSQLNAIYCVSYLSPEVRGVISLVEGLN